MGRWTPRWREIVVHHSAGPDRAHLDTFGIRRFHVGARGWADIGYHFLVEGVGEDGLVDPAHAETLTYLAVAGRPLTRWGAHCPGKNGTAIGVCLVGDFTLEPPTPRQLIVAADLIAGLMWAMFGRDDPAALNLEPGELGRNLAAIVRGRVTAHRDHKATACPGDAFDINVLREAVRAQLLKI